MSQVIDKLLSHTGVSSTPRPSGIRTHNVSGDRHRNILNPTIIPLQPRRPLYKNINTNSIH